MATISQINANRRNALKSTGPKSPAGKARASQNAIRHGFASKQIVLNTENEADFQALHAEFVDEYQPSSPTECMLVDEVAVAAWRLRRMQSLETVLLDVRFVLEPGSWDPDVRSKFDQQDPSWTRYRQVQAWKSCDAFEQMSRYEARTRRAFYRALAELRRHKDSCRTEPCRTEPCRDRNKGAAPRTPTKAFGRTQSLPTKSGTSRPIGFVLPNLLNSSLPSPAGSPSIPAGTPQGGSPDRKKPC